MLWLMADGKRMTLSVWGAAGVPGAWKHRAHPHQLSQPLLHRHLPTGHSLRAGISHEQGVLMSMAGGGVDLFLTLSHGLGGEGEGHLVEQPFLCSHQASDIWGVWQEGTAKVNEARPPY